MERNILHAKPKFAATLRINCWYCDNTILFWIETFFHDSTVSKKVANASKILICALSRLRNGVTVLSVCDTEFLQSEAAEPFLVQTGYFFRMEKETYCWYCKEVEKPTSKLQRCSGCVRAAYCCRDHQKADWSNHRKLCQPFKLFQKEGTPYLTVATSRTVQPGAEIVTGLSLLKLGILKDVPKLK